MLAFWNVLTQNTSLNLLILILDHGCHHLSLSCRKTGDMNSACSYSHVITALFYKFTYLLLNQRLLFSGYLISCCKMQFFKLKLRSFKSPKKSLSVQTGAWGCNQLKTDQCICTNNPNIDSDIQ